MKNPTSRLSMAFAAAITFVMASGLPALAREKEKEKETPVQGSIQVKPGTKGERLPQLAKVSLQDAILSARAKAKGKVIQAVLENEEGSLVYSVEILSSNGKLREILVDAGTGKVLSQQENPKDHEEEGDNDDERE